MGQTGKNLSAAGAGPRNREVILFSWKWGKEDGVSGKDSLRWSPNARPNMGHFQSLADALHLGSIEGFGVPSKAT